MGEQATSFFGLLSRLVDLLPLLLRQAGEFFSLNLPHDQVPIVHLELLWLKLQMSGTYRQYEGIPLLQPFSWCALRDTRQLAPEMVLLIGARDTDYHTADRGIIVSCEYPSIS
jgi:hypothetical protein